MANLTQWTKWREEYYAGLKQIIDDAPYRMTQLAVESEGGHYVPDVAKAFVDKAIKEGAIKESEPLSFLKMSYFAMAELVAYQNKEEVSVQDVEALCHEPDYPYKEITTADDYISYALWVFHMPILKACRYVFSNHPRACKNVIIDLFKQAGEEIDFSYFRLRKEELFNYFRSVTPFCLHNTLADMKCPYAEEVFDAVQDGDYEFFKILCYDKNLDFTELSEIVGYLQSGLIGSINDTEEIFESDENPDEEIGEKIYSRLKNVTSMAGLPHFNQEDFKAGATILKQDIVGELLPFIQTEEDASIISAIAFDVASMYSFIERMDDGELKEINRLLEHPDFDALVKLAQGLFCGRYDRFPNNVTIHFSPEEQNEMLSYTQADKNEEQGVAKAEEGNKNKSNAGAPKQIWITGHGTEEELTKKIQTIQPSLKGELKEMELDDKATLSASAAIIIYSVYSIGLTKEKMCTAPAERVVKAPRTTVNQYLKRLYGWYDKLIEMSVDQKNASKASSLIGKWKNEDAIRAGFIVDNFAELKRVINNTMFALGNEFGVATGLQYIPKREKGDAALGGAIEYTDGMEQRDFTVKSKTGIPMSEKY